MTWDYPLFSLNVGGYRVAAKKYFDSNSRPTGELGESLCFAFLLD
jgi:hypothetical protein